MPRPRDQIRLETDAGAFDAFEKVALAEDLFDLRTLTIELGDARAWNELRRRLQHGQRMRLYLNGRIQFTGFLEDREGPVDPDAGATLQVVLRTALADARYRSADPKVSMKGVSIKQFILALFAPLGLGPSDFNFAAATDADLATGKKRGFLDPVDLEPLKADQAKVTPPATVYDTAAKHLQRHHLMMWDGADGRIIIGKPAVSAPPSYRFQLRRGVDARGNNLSTARRIEDWSELPSEVWVYGNSFAKDIVRVANKGVAVDLDAVLAQGLGTPSHFNRMVLIPSEGAKTQAQAEAQAKRELAARSRNKDAWEMTTDGWSYWTGHEAVPLVHNTIADVDIETVSGTGAGRYLIARVVRQLDADGGPVAQLHLIAPAALEL